VEPLLAEMQAYDALFQAGLRHGDTACPAVAAVLRVLWDSFVDVATSTLSTALQAELTLHAELRHANSELRHAQRELSQLQIQHRKIT
jgi:hypothetical protein